MSGSSRLCSVHIAANLNDVEDLVLSKDNDQDYKFVLLQKDDSMNMHYDFF